MKKEDNKGSFLNTSKNVEKTGLFNTKNVEDLKSKEKLVNKELGNEIQRGQKN